MMKPTLHDVAKKAGVSVTTASRALNGHSDVNESTRKHIESVAKEINYSPNINARRLVMNKSNRIGFIVFGFGVASGEDNFVYEVLVGLQKESNNLGYEVVFLLGDLHLNDHDFSLERIKMSHDLVGLVIMGLPADKYNLLKELDQNFPVVLIDGNYPNTKLSTVSINNFQAGQDAGNLFKQNERKNPVFLYGSKGSFASELRLSGLKSIFPNLEDEYVLLGHYQEEKGYELINALLDKGTYFDCILSANDMMAIGAIKALQHHNKRVGVDVDIIGFDNIPIGKYTTPTLSTINVDKELMGRKSISEINRLLKDESYGQEIVLDHNLVVRESINYPSKK